MVGFLAICVLIRCGMCDIADKALFSRLFSLALAQQRIVKTVFAIQVDGARRANSGGDGSVTTVCVRSSLGLALGAPWPNKVSGHVCFLNELWAKPMFTSRARMANSDEWKCGIRFNEGMNSDK